MPNSGALIETAGSVVTLGPHSQRPEVPPGDGSRDAACLAMVLACPGRTSRFARAADSCTGEPTGPAYAIDRICSTAYIHEMMIDAIDLFRALADKTRLRCLALLTAEGELCVCELTAAIGLSQPKVSRHLATLRIAGIVDDRRNGQWIYYRLHPDLPAWVRRVLRATFLAADSDRTYSADRISVRRITRRPKGMCRGSAATAARAPSRQNQRPSSP